MLLCSVWVIWNVSDTTCSPNTLKVRSICRILWAAKVKSSVRYSSSGKKCGTRIVEILSCQAISSQFSASKVLCTKATTSMTLLSFCSSCLTTCMKMLIEFWSSHTSRCQTCMAVKSNRLTLIGRSIFNATSLLWSTSCKVSLSLQCSALNANIKNPHLMPSRRSSCQFRTRRKFNSTSCRSFHMN